MNTSIIILIIFFILVILGAIGYFFYKYYTQPKTPCPINNISNYNIDEKPMKVSDLAQRIMSSVINRIKENFALTTGTVTSISAMIPGVNYTRGTLKSGISNTLTDAKNGGINNCSPYPSTIYTQTGTVDPCYGYTSTSIGVSNDCYRKLWANAGCGGDPFLIPDKANWNASQNYSSLVSDTQTWYYYSKVLKNPYHIQYCT